LEAVWVFFSDLCGNGDIACRITPFQHPRLLFSAVPGVFLTGFALDPETGGLPEVLLACTRVWVPADGARG